MKIAIVSGGTGGHIYPGIAIAREIKRQNPEAKILFLGSHDGLEKNIVPREGFPIKLIKSRALLRKLSYKALSAPFISAIGIIQAIWILSAFKPQALISTGGYASLPVILAAKILRLPVILQEQNVLPGAVNRYCHRLAKKVFLAFNESLKYIPGEIVGNPVRREIITAGREQARQKLGLAREEKVVLVMGGSQGSKNINETVMSAIERIPANVKVLHIIGNRDFGWVSRYLEGRELKNYKAFPYLHNMEDALAAADLVISRAGATAIAEFLVRSLPMVLIPFPFAAEDHQRLNARVIADRGGGIVVEDRAFTADKFISIISDSALNYGKMKEALSDFSRNNAAERIYQFVCQ